MYWRHGRRTLRSARRGTILSTPRRSRSIVRLVPAAASQRIALAQVAAVGPVPLDSIGETHGELLAHRRQAAGEARSHVRPTRALANFSRCESEAVVAHPLALLERVWI